jgi:hypothetical protein
MSIAVGHAAFDDRAYIKLEIKKDAEEQNL